MANILRLVVVVCGFCSSDVAFAGFTTRKLGPQPIWNSTVTDKLRQDLLLNYDKFARPAQHYNTTKVVFGLTIRHIELNEFKSTLVVHSWIRLSWKDEKLQWNSTNYGGLETLNLADHEIWQPDIFLYNSATSSGITHYGNVNCIVYEGGDVLWVPPAQFSVLCNLNLKYWPFDTQRCEMIFGSWTYNGDQIDIDPDNDGVKMELLIENSEWNIVDKSLKKNMKYYACCPSPYPDITIDLTLSRISPSYKALIVTPAFVVIILVLVNFWLPPQAGEKLILNGCTALIICLFMLYFTQKIPTMGTHTPLIVFFYSSCLYVVGFSIITSVVVIWLSRTKHSSPLPWIVKQPLTGTFGKILGLQTYIQQSSMTSHRVTAEEMRDHQVTDFDENNSGDEHHIIKSSNKMSLQQDWILLAAAIDRITFCFFSFLFLILTIVYSV
ncbi:nicotinic acetylcholine receptor alpha 10 subunit precursor [Tribolium castaneum]|uniref:Nicotinic acetylcholine receptor subunit alpha10 n=1 Tax=Tribolium castaneum TaxID=7070 RepID=A8DIV1_TRICA|nr:nicotinic acetylcholine receptor alpha 10 subunit precursor [Tribolium castaneum]ABS86914.1 nicotinic acetylcholine receptor subunit alpha10 [Tribolium castaneum]EFA02806.1 nicotinic acetylcholine receptor subunit alpha10 [Tribolium castaneum]|eukprot:NP_001103247.1 nicotinic acetylcholine receptor alpha 10 subunit precursor [Tribolium castaneum]